MAKSSLALIEQASDSFMATPVMRTREGRVGAFRVGMDVMEDGRWSSLNHSFRRNADHLRTALAKAEITPLAIIPDKFWSKIVEDAGLVDFGLERHSDMIPLGVGEIAEEAVKTEPLAIIFFSLVGVVVYGLSVGLTDWYQFPWWGNMLISGAVTGVSGAASFVAYLFVCAKILDLEPSAPFARLSAILYLRSRDRRDVLRRMINLGREHQSQRVRIELPEPPADVQEVLRKTSALDVRELRVTTTVEAISMGQTVDQILSAEIAQQAIDRRIEAARIREMMREDPIIYARHGDAVAIIAQYGEFPIEEDVVAKAISIDTING